MSKRKHDEEDSLSTASSDSADSLGNVEDYRRAKRNRRVRFSERTVFHFPRTQGYTCVPSNGGTTLGMKHKHIYVERVLISDDDLSESEHSYDSADSEEEHCFMPIPQKDRKDILKAAGVTKINKQEAIECMQIRYSRQICGCSCKGFCQPESCSCYVNGINCQVDRDGFPCGCTREGCQNPNGRHEYDPITVRRHFIDTVLKLRGEQCLWQETAYSDQGDNVVSNVQVSIPVLSFASVS